MRFWGFEKENFSTTFHSMTATCQLTHVEESILTLLKGYELYGLEIIAALDEGSGGRLNLGYGTLYPILRRLEKK